MRVSKERAAEHRKRILSSAGRLFREKGIGATGVDSITEDAGLTHGAIYSQFGSKEAIAIESIRVALGDSKRTWLRAVAKKGEAPVFRAIVQSYLSARHRDAPGNGCVVAALAGDISRQPRSVRDAFTEEFKHSLEFLAEVVATDDSSITEEDMLAAFAAMAGALMLSRAVTDESLSERILTVAARWIDNRAKSRPGVRARA